MSVTNLKNIENLSVPLSIPLEAKQKLLLISEAFYNFSFNCLVSLDRFEKLDWKLDANRMYDLFFDYAMSTPEYRKIFLSIDDGNFSYQNLYFNYYNHVYEFMIFIEMVNEKKFFNKYKIIPLDFSVDDKTTYIRRMDYFDNKFTDLNNKRNFLKLTCFAVEIVRNDSII